MRPAIDLVAVLDEMRAALTAAGYSAEVGVSVDVSAWRYQGAAGPRYSTSMRLWVADPVKQFFADIAALRAWLGLTSSDQIPVVVMPEEKTEVRT